MGWVSEDIKRKIKEVLKEKNNVMEPSFKKKIKIPLFLNHKLPKLSVNDIYWNDYEYMGTNILMRRLRNREEKLNFNKTRFDLASRLGIYDEINNCWLKESQISVTELKKLFPLCSEIIKISPFILYNGDKNSGCLIGVSGNENFYFEENKIFRHIYGNENPYSPHYDDDDVISNNHLVFFSEYFRNEIIICDVFEHYHNLHYNILEKIYEKSYLDEFLRPLAVVTSDYSNIFHDLEREVYFNYRDEKGQFAFLSSEQNKKIYWHETEPDIIEGEDLKYIQSKLKSLENFVEPFIISKEPCFKNKQNVNNKVNTSKKNKI